MNEQFTGYFRRLRDLLRAGITNQGHDARNLPQTMSRQRLRRDLFIRRNRELTAQYGYNMPRKVRRRIALDSAHKAKVSVAHA